MSELNLPEGTHRQIKTLLWRGLSIRLVAEEVSCSLSLVDRIKAGTVAHYTPWPDGSIGRMKDSQRKQLAYHRNQDRKEEYHRKQAQNHMGHDAELPAYTTWKKRAQAVDLELKEETGVNALTDDMPKAKRLATINDWTRAYNAWKEQNPRPARTAAEADQKSS